MKFAKVIETILLFDRNETNIAARDNHTAGTAMQSTSQKAAHDKNIFQCTVLVFERCWDFSILDENRGVFEKDRPEDEMMSWAGNELFAARQDSILEQMGAPWVKRQL